MICATKNDSHQIRVTIEHDQDTENPAEWDGGQWKPISFINEYTNYEDPRNYIHLKVDEDLAKSNGRRAATTVEPNDVGLRRKLEVGTAFFMDCYRHSNVIWSIHGDGPQCEWDNSRYAGILLWEHDTKGMKAKTYDERAKHAASFLETYTAWCNGECYWYRIEMIHNCDERGQDEEELESSSGYIGDSIEIALSNALSDLHNIYPDAEIIYTGDSAWIGEHITIETDTHQ